MTGVKPTVLRFWESEFSQLSPRKNKFGHRVYQASDINLVLQIKRLLYEEGHTVKGAQKILAAPRESDRKVDIKYIKKSLNEMLRLIRERKKDE